jgi:pimeloyl-ACP methyl ester carboxylesterase
MPSTITLLAIHPKPGVAIARLLAAFALMVIACGPSGKKVVAEVESKGVRIAYSRCGTGDTTLLFVHGWCIDKDYWKPQLEEFCPRYTVVAIDLPGFGLSGKSRRDWSFDNYADDIANVIDQLHLENVILFGHSMSGDIILKADNKFPKSLLGIVGIDNLHVPGGPMNEQQKKQTDDFFALLRSRFDSTVNKYMRAELFQPGTPQAVIDRVMNSVFSADSLVASDVLQSLSVVAQEEQTMMRGLSHKLYLVNSDVRPVQMDSLAKYCSKGFMLVPVHATGHYPMIEKPAEFNDALRKVIVDIAAGH